MEEFGLVKGHFFDFEVFLGGFAFDEVGGEGVGAADESEDGGGGSYFGAEGAECFADEGCGGGWVDHVHLSGCL